MKQVFRAMLVGGFVAACGVPAFGDQLANYTVTSSNDAHNTTHPNDVTPTQGLTEGVLSPASHFVMGSGLNAGYPFGYSIASTTTYYPTDLADAEAQDTYVTFTISPLAGTTLNVSDIDFSAAQFSSDFAGGNNNNPNANGAPPSGYTASLTSSLDNFTSDLGDIAFNFTTSGSDIVLPAAFDDLTTPVTFHLEFYGTPGGAEPAYTYLYLSDGSAINVNGSSAVVAPEPATCSLLALGSCGLLARRKRSAAR